MKKLSFFVFVKIGLRIILLTSLGPTENKNKPWGNRRFFQNIPFYFYSLVTEYIKSVQTFTGPGGIGHPPPLYVFSKHE